MISCSLAKVCVIGVESFKVKANAVSEVDAERDRRRRESKAVNGSRVSKRDLQTARAREKEREREVLLETIRYSL